MLGKPAFRVADSGEITAADLCGGSPGFVYAQTNCEGIAEASHLQDLGFRLVDTNVQLERDVAGMWYSEPLMPGDEVRFAEAGDQQAVEDVAGNSFRLTRFHLDPLVATGAADAIKRAWAANFFSGRRGDWMVVATHESRVCGFLQLLSRDDVLLIDLIALDAAAQGRRLAGRMIEFAAQNCPGFRKMKVGTQVANVRSLRLYERLGFRVGQSSYTFHYHGPVRSLES